MHAADVAMRDLVLRIDGQRERFYRGMVQAVDLVEMRDPFLRILYGLPEHRVQDERQWNENDQRSEIRVALVHQQYEQDPDKPAAQIAHP